MTDEGKRTRKITHREFESINEEMRKDVTKNIVQYSKTSGSKIARFVDQKPLEKCVLSQYGKFKKVFRKMEPLDERYERERGKNVINYDMSKFRTCDVPMNMSIEEQYFNTYGKGFDGTENPTQMHQIFRCKHCGRKIMADPAVMPLNCPVCQTLTPLGELVRDNKQKRW